MENGNNETNTPVSGKGTPAPQINPAVLGWGITAVFFAILDCIYHAPSAGIFAKFFAVIVGGVLGLIGALIGNAIRKFVMPDAVFTTGGFAQLLWIRIFWKIGPQTIGMLIGVFFGSGFVLM